MPSLGRSLPNNENGPFDLANIATAVVDTAGRVIGWSSEAEQLFGYPAEEVLARPAADFLDLPRSAGIPAGRDGIAGRWSGKLTARHRSGHRITLGVQIAPLSGTGPLSMALISAIDLRRTPWWAVSQSVLERFLARVPLGLAVLDTDLRYTWLNSAIEQMTGVSLAERKGLRVTEALRGPAIEEMEAQLRHALETGEPVLGFEYRGHTKADPERERVFATSFLRLDDSAGRVLGVCYLGLDVTDRRRAQERLSLLTESGARIGSTLDITRTAEELTETAVPRLADFVTIDLFDAVLRGEEPSATPARDTASLVRVAHRSLQAGCPEAAVAVGDPSGYSADSPVVRCLAEGRALLEPELAAPAGTALALDMDRTERVRRFGLRSLIVVPVRARGACLGVAVFMRGQTSERFEEGDLQLAEEFVSRAALSLDNARRFTREHAAALTLQRSLLPTTLVGGTCLEVASRYLPAGTREGVGGDWFDVIPLSGARVALVVGDVVGHGINAAATMGRLRMAVHTLAGMDLPPDELLAHLDDLVLRLIDEGAADQDEAAATAVLGATCLCAIYDPVTRRCAMARAGHPSPAVVGPDGAVEFADLPGGPPLGLGSMPFEAAELELPEGSLLALFTNGLIQTYHPDLDLGLQRLREVLRHRERSLEEICDHVLSALLTRPQTDDAALLIARTHALGADRVASWDLPADPAFVGNARSLAARTLARWGLDELVFTTELVVSELVTNAIRYAAGPIQLRLIREAVLICEVSDTGNTSPHLRHARTTDEGGRGLFLVAQLTHRWGTRYTADGKIIWAEQSYPAPGEAEAPEAPEQPQLPEQPG